MATPRPEIFLLALLLREMSSMTHRTLHLVDVECRIAVHYELGVLTIWYKALDVNILKSAVRDRPTNLC